MPHRLVVNCRHDIYDVYCGRGTPYGNPFITGVDGNRLEVIEMFKNYLFNNPELIELVKTELKGKTLGCWCAPKSCHCDILADVANS
jgi:hypothetical protein